MQSSYQRLNQQHRDTIYRLLKLGKRQNEIAEAIGFSEGTVCREISRNSGKKGYRSKQAGRLAEARKLNQRRPKKITGDLATEIEERLVRHHSPEQITGALRKQGVDAPCHETIYQYIQQDKKAGGSLFRCLRINGVRRYKHRNKSNRSKIQERTGIEMRPDSVDKRIFYGDWEADLVEGSKGTGFILTLVDRKSRFTIFRKLADKTKNLVSLEIIRALTPMKVRTITYDNGLEFAGHLEISRALGAKGYFCAPYHSWEKGLVENHNGLLRQYFEKGSSFLSIDAQILQEVEDEINERPRKKLDYHPPIYYKNKLSVV